MIALLLRSMPAAQGEVHTWADRRQHKKVGRKWVVLGSGGGRREQGRVNFAGALSSRLGGVVEGALAGWRVGTYEDLARVVASGPFDTAHKMFRAVKDAVDATAAPASDKRLAVDLVGRTLVDLRSTYSEKPRVRLTMRVVSKRGKVWWRPNPRLPAVRPTAVRWAKSVLGGWDVARVPTSAQVKSMVASGIARLVAGRINPRREWLVAQHVSETSVPWREEERGIVATLKQVRQARKRSRRTAEVRLTVPFAYAVQFLMAHVRGKRTRSNLVGQIVRSAGYRKVAADG